MRPTSSCTTCRSRKKKCHSTPSDDVCVLCASKGLQCDLVRIRQDLSQSTTPNSLTFSRPWPLAPAVPPPDIIGPYCEDILTNESVCHHLINLYFDLIHNHQQILFHRQAFLEEKRKGTLPEYILLGIFALVARFSNHVYFNAAAPMERAGPLLQRALSLFNTRLVPISLHSLQGSILIAFTCFVEGFTDHEALLNAQAGRMVQVLGLPDMTQPASLQQEVEIRIFWHALMSDIWYAARTSVPRQIVEKSSIPLPAGEDIFESMMPADMSPCELTREERRMSVWANIIGLHGIFAQTMTLLETIAREPSLEFMANARVRTLTIEIDNWLHNLPAHLHNTPSNLEAFQARRRGRQIAVLHLIFHHLGQMLYYQYLDKTTGVEGDREVVEYATRCKAHAEALSSLLWTTNTTSGMECLWSPVNGHLIVVASSVHMHTLLFEPDAPHIDRIKRLLEQNFEMLLQFRRYWPTLQASLSRLQAFHRSCYRGSRESCFRMDAWMFTFLNNYDSPIPERPLPEGSGLESELEPEPWVSLWPELTSYDSAARGELASLLSFD